MQSGQNILGAFFDAIAHDPRIGVSHISLYCALVQSSQQPGEPVLFMSYELMRVAKISGLGTYHRCIRDLDAFGYIRYVPSYNHRKKSKAYLIQSEH